MNKWLLSALMIILLLGAAYLAVATETGRTMLNSTATTRAMLQEVDALLTNDRGNAELLYKRAQLAENLAELGEQVPPVQADGKIKDADYLRSIGAYADLERLEQEQTAAQFSYLESLHERMLAGAQLSAIEKSELIASGILDDQRSNRSDRNRLDDVGGPDGYGYRWVDNLGGDTATFAWVDIVGAPGAVDIGPLHNQDDAVTAVPLSFTFPFYGVGRTTVYPGTNGAISMTSSQSFSNTCTLPSSTFPSGAIWPLWDDQHTGRGGTGVGGSVSDSGSVWYKDEGTRIIIQWDSVGRYAFPATFDHAYSYQAILYASGKIKLQYKELYRNPANAVFPSATIGIQQGSSAPNNNYLTYRCNTVADAGQDTIRNRAVWFYQLFLDNDFSCISVVEPAQLRVSPSQVMNIVGRFRNSGSITQSSPVRYRFNNGATVTEATAVLAQNQSEDHDFAGTVTAPAAVGDYPLVLWSDLAVDQDRGNDTCRVTIQVRECYDVAQADGFTDTGTTCGQLNDWSNTCLGSADGGEDYIYRWTTTTNGAWNLQLIGAATTRGIVVSSSCPPDSFNCIAFLNQFQDTLSLNCVPLAAGTYYIMVDRSSSCDATYTLNVTPCTDIGRCCYNGGADCIDNGAFECQQLAGNWERTVTCASSPCPTFLDGGNTCADAPLLAVPATVRGNSVGAGDNDPGFQCALGSTDPYEGFNTAPDEWYRIVGTGDSITVSLCSGYTAFDTQILVVCTDDCQNFTCVAGNDDATCSFSGLRSTAKFCSEVGRSYYVVVDGWGSGSGNFELSVTLGSACTGAANCTPLGRCCYLSGGLPDCEDNLAAECANLGGQWNAVFLCSTPCPIGRCCYNLGQSCSNNTQLECNVIGGDWSSTLTCATACPIPLPNDNCETATQLIVVPDGSVTAAVDLTTATMTCGDTCDYDSNGPDIFYYFTLTQCRLIAVMADPTDTHISLYADGQCCVTPALYCNDDYGNNDDLDLLPWLPAGTRPTYVLASMFADTLQPGTYYIRAGHYGTTTSVYTLTLFDFGSCGAVPCDPIINLTAYVATVTNIADHIQLRFTAPQLADYKIWFTNNPNNDGNPDNGSDPNFTLLATLPDVAAGPVLWDGAPAFDNFRYYVVTADCTP